MSTPVLKVCSPHYHDNLECVVVGNEEWKYSALARLFAEQPYESCFTVGRGMASGSNFILKCYSPDFMPIGQNYIGKHIPVYIKRMNQDDIDNLKLKPPEGGFLDSFDNIVLHLNNTEEDLEKEGYIKAELLDDDTIVIYTTALIEGGAIQNEIYQV